MARGKTRGHGAAGVSAQGKLGPDLDLARQVTQGAAAWLPSSPFTTERVPLRAMPLDVLAAEGFRLAAVLDEYWQEASPPRCGPLPALRQHLPTAGFGERSAEQLRGLAVTLLLLDGQLHTRRPWSRPSPVTEARGYIQEARRRLRYAATFTPGEEGNAFREQLRQFSKRVGDTTADEGLGMQLHAWAALLEQRWDQLTQVDPSAEPEMITRVRTLAQYCLERASKAYRPEVDETTLLLQCQRDWVATQLHDQLRRLRRVTDFAFRKHPEIAKLAHSDHLRTLRQRSRKAGSRGGTGT
jgi:hypothetical protein